MKKTWVVPALKKVTIAEITASGHLTTADGQGQQAS